MYLKKIEVKGFKSFADKIDLDFIGGITAIVGPNGSGKSNISDAIRWVLGEQSAKTLRGAKMEDIIFAGTENRKSLGCAEVTLTIDNGTKILPIDYSEVTVTRRLYRSGESEYLLNNTICRLKDIVEVFMDTGIGKDGYSLIGQGKIDEILSSRSEDRRNLFEEAAGIVKYKTRKNEAERRLENTKQNLLRITDIIEELREQMGPLSEQSAVAKKFLSLREELKDLEISVILHNYSSSKIKLDNMLKTLEELSGSSVENEVKRNEILEIIQLEKEKLSISEADLEGANNERFELEKNLEAKQGNLKLLNERYDNLNRDLNRINEDIDGLKQTIVKIEDEKGEHEQNKMLLEEKVIDQNGIIEQILEEYSEFNKKCLEYENIIDNNKGDQIQILKDVSNINNKINSSEIINQNLNSRKNQLEREVQLRRDRLSELKVHMEKSMERIGHFNEKLNFARERIKENILAGNLLKENRDKLIGSRNMTFDRLKSSEARYGTLSDMEKDMEGFNRAVKSVISNYRDDVSVFGTVADIIEVPKGYETAAEIALGFSVQNIIVDNEETASKLIGYLKKNHLGRATFLPLTTIKTRELNIDRNKLNVKGYLGIASEIVKYNPKFKNAVSNLLGRVLVCDTLENAKVLARNTEFNFRIVTLDGDVINSGGSFTGGSNNVKGSGLFSRKNEIKELEDKIEENKIMLQDIEAKMLESSSDIENNRRKQDEINSDIQSITLDLRGEENKTLEIKRQINEVEVNIRDIGVELEQIEYEFDKNILMIEENKAKLKELNQRQEKVEKDLNLLQEEYKSYQSGREEISERITAEKVALTEKQKSLEMVKSKIDEIQGEIKNINNRIGILTRQLGETQDRIHETKESIKGIIADIQKSAELIVIVKDKVFELETLKKDIMNKIAQREKELLSVDETLKGITASMHKLEISKSKLETDIELQCNKLWEEYELSIAQADKYKKEISNIAEANKKVNEIKLSIKQLGNVNVNSIEESKRVNERYEFLESQREDLTKAEQSLADIIEELTKKMKIQFEENFAIIRENFSTTFKELFGGGYADLKLENDDILNSGIDIIVQPPGKKLQSLSLLSGGERGLAAIALLFAILKMKPTPFCVLDEIEAALDDANVNRFAEFLKDYSSNTQFIMITHRKGSMAVADTLYGVTMEEKGVSKIISLKLRGGK